MSFVYILIHIYTVNENKMKTNAITTTINSPKSTIVIRVFAKIKIYDQFARVKVSTAFRNCVAK